MAMDGSRATVAPVRGARDKEKDVKMNFSEEEYSIPKLDHPLKRSLQQTLGKEVRDKTHEKNVVTFSTALVKRISGVKLRSSVNLGSPTQGNDNIDTDCCLDEEDFAQ